MSDREKLHKCVWEIVKIFPFHLRYFITFCLTKRRFPHFVGKKDYSDYIFEDCFFGRHDNHAFLADKLEVRKYIEKRGLSSTLTKLYGAWDNADKIDFDKLPNQFALKCNHSCAMNIICYDRSVLDIDKVKNQLNEWLKTKHPVFFERHYFKIKPMIICEELIPNNEDGFFPIDYKIHCANGKPIFIQCCFERTTVDAGRRVLYDTDWKNLHYILNDSHYSDEEVPRPKHLEEMLKDASILSKGLDYARIDFYDTDERVLFGEITLTPMGGWLSYFKQEALDIMGNAIRKGKREGKWKRILIEPSQLTV